MEGKQIKEVKPPKKEEDIELPSKESSKVQEVKEKNLDTMKTPPQPKEKEKKKIRDPGRYYRIFPHWMKKQCWEKSQTVLGRDPDRWRLDAVGNPVLNALRGCFGPFCHEYDHILPYSKGGRTELDNCMVLQTKVNRFKSNHVDMGFCDLRNSVESIHYTDREMDLIERAAYGNIKLIKTVIDGEEGSEGCNKAKNELA